MPPVMRTTVCPIATTKSGSRAERRLAKFSEEAKPGVKGRRAKK
jgi:hypothetical protein